jgi:hypothetical protein
VGHGGGDRKTPTTYKKEDPMRPTLLALLLTAAACGGTDGADPPGDAPDPVGLTCADVSQFNYAPAGFNGICEVDASDDEFAIGPNRLALDDYSPSPGVLWTSVHEWAERPGEYGVIVTSNGSATCEWRACRLPDLPTCDEVADAAVTSGCVTEAQRTQAADQCHTISNQTYSCPLEAAEWMDCITDGGCAGCAAPADCT